MQKDNIILKKYGILKNYKGTLLLLVGIIIGAVCGVIFGPKASVVRPLGDLFLNIIFVMVVPMVFFSISSAICNMYRSRMIGKVLGWSIAVFFGMTVVAGIVSYLFCSVWNPLGSFSTEIPEVSRGAASADIPIGQTLVNMFTVDDFPKLLSKSALLPMIVFSILFGLGTALTGEKGRPMADFLDSGMAVVMKIMEIVMVAAPVCLGCYFADIIGNLGSQIIGGYLRSLVIYLAAAAVIFFIANSLYVFFSGGTEGLKSYWKNLVRPSLTAIGTCSSAACIPVNIQAAKDMGVDEKISETVIPLGINLHKDGSVVGAVIKIMFAISFFGLDGYGVLAVIGISILESIVLGAIPIGGMTGEILICSILGIDPSFAATLLVIGTIIDIPATLLNSTGNIAGAYLVDRLCRQSSD